MLNFEPDADYRRGRNKYYSMAFYLLGVRRGQLSCTFYPPEDLAAVSRG